MPSARDVESVIASKDVVADGQSIVERACHKEKKNCSSKRRNDESVIAFEKRIEHGHGIPPFCVPASELLTFRHPPGAVVTSSPGSCR